MNPATRNDTTSLDARTLGASMNRLLHTPLAALRASIESLTAELGASDPRGRSLLEGALEQVSRMSRDVESLVDFAVPRAIARQGCRAEEVATSALKRLPHAWRARVQYARGEPDFRMETDAALLAVALSHVLQGACERSHAHGTVLLQVREEGANACFAVVLDERDPQQHAALRSRGTWNAAEESSAERVRMSIARRDVERLGGSLEHKSTERGLSCTCLWVPLTHGGERTAGNDERA